MRTATGARVWELEAAELLDRRRTSREAVEEYARLRRAGVSAQPAAVLALHAGSDCDGSLRSYWRHQQQGRTHAACRQAHAAARRDRRRSLTTERRLRERTRLIGVGVNAAAADLLAGLHVTRPSRAMRARWAREDQARYWETRRPAASPVPSEQAL